MLTPEGAVQDVLLWPSHTQQEESLTETQLKLWSQHCTFRPPFSTQGWMNLVWEWEKRARKHSGNPSVEWMGPCQGCDVSLSAWSTSIQALLGLTESDHGQSMGAAPCRGSVRSGHLSSPTQLEEDTPHGKSNTLPAKPDVGKGEEIS